MCNNTTPQYASIETPFGCSPPDVRCPICGVSVYQDADEDGNVAYCRHLAFHYSCDCSEFLHASDRFTAVTREIEAEELRYSDIKEKLTTAGFGNELLILEITCSGMACGPVSSTEIMGFDYQSIAD